MRPRNNVLRGPGREYKGNEFALKLEKMKKKYKEMEEKEKEKAGKKMEEAWKDVVNIDQYCNGLVEMVNDLLRNKSLPKMTGLIKKEILKRGLMEEKEAEEGMVKFREIFIDKLQLYFDFLDSEVRHKILDVNTVKECLNAGADNEEKHRQTMNRLMKGMLDLTEQTKQVKARHLLTEVTRKFLAKDVQIKSSHSVKKSIHNVEKAVQFAEGMKEKLDSVDDILTNQFLYAKLEAKYKKLCNKGKKQNPIIETGIETQVEVQAEKQLDLNILENLENSENAENSQGLQDPEKVESNDV